MIFKENTDVLFDTHKKTNKITLSCTNEVQIEGARNFIENFRSWLSCFECEDEVQTDLLKQIIDDVEITFGKKYQEIVRNF